MRPLSLMLLATALAGSAIAFARPAATPDEDRLQVLAASSLTDVLPKLATAWTAHGNHTVNLSFDATSRLAQQIESGAPADVFVAADVDWMDDLAEARLVDEATVVNLAGNTLVAVVPRTSELTVANPAQLDQPGIQHLALAGENVPAGKYARSALANAGAWSALAPRVVNGDTVRSVLRWVATGEAEAGVVYGTDARVEPRVKVAFSFAPGTYPPIVYPAAVVTAATHPKDAAAFLRFCQGAEARAILAEAGFTPPPK
ncbi:molybdate ABC transporter substrate-binding protein [Deltaproteobacteria bacterium]|nr:molybdate ABC transporter substrate-binding protein [Deltaproteobacteria bacterium]